MDNLISLLNAPGACTQEVRSKILELIQTWATAFEGMPQLSYVVDVYNRLGNEGHEFPPRVRITSSFVDSSAVSFILSAPASSSAESLSAARMDRLRCVYAVSNGIYIYQSQASLPELW